MRAAITLITGPSGAGKSTYCAKAIQPARKSGRPVSGVLSEAEIRDGQKIAIRARDLRTDEVRVLARPAEGLAYAPDVGTKGIRTPRWAFDEAALGWAGRVFETALPTGLLVVDELGILEFERAQGWLSAFDALASGRFDEALVTIRPSLLGAAKRRWPAAAVIDLGAQ